MEINATPLLNMNLIFDLHIDLPELFEWSSWSSCSKSCIDSTSEFPIMKRARCGINQDSKCIQETTRCSNIPVCPLGKQKIRNKRYSLY